MKKGNPMALLPIVVFVLLYLGTGIIFEYVLKINMGFYNIPIVVVFLIALYVALFQNRKLSLDKKLEIMGHGIGDKNIVMMILIFLEAGIFVGVVGRGSAQSVAYFLLSIIPSRFAVAVMFVVACLVSVSMGTSVGTITLIVPIASALAQTGGFSLPLTIGSVIGGAMFGDNLSFISDTTIAACNGQGCDMKDKFRENFAIALPAALVNIFVIILLSIKSPISSFEIPEYNMVYIIPYILVLAGGIIGINVLKVLFVGIISGIVITRITGACTTVEMVVNIGSGVSGMFETSIVAILVSAIGALIRENGGFDTLINCLTRVFKGKKFGQIGIGVLVILLDIATANNTVAIVMANPIALELSKQYGISPRKTASVLDTFSCIAQGIIPYGAQMLVAVSAANTLGVTISPFEIIPNLLYPYLLLISSVAFIFLKKDN